MPSLINLSSLAARAYTVQPRDALAKGAHSVAAQRVHTSTTSGTPASDDGVRIDLSAAARQALAQRTGDPLKKPAPAHQPKVTISSVLTAQEAAQQSAPLVQASGAGRREAPLASARAEARRDVPPGSRIDIQI